MRKVCAIVVLAVLFLSYAKTQAWVPIPLGQKVGPGLTTPGTGLNGEYYDRTPANASDVVSYAGSNPADGSFIGTEIRYGITSFGTSNMTQFLGPDGPSLTGGGSDNQDSISLILNGFINILDSYDNDLGTPGIQVDFYSGSDDGSRVTIGGVAVVNNDAFQGPPGGAAGPGTADFAEAGQYPIELVFYEGGGGEEWQLGSSIATGLPNAYSSGLNALASTSLNNTAILLLESFNPPPPLTPEPSTILLFGICAVGLAGRLLWTRKHSA